MHLSKFLNLLCYYSLDEGSGSYAFDQGLSFIDDITWDTESANIRKTNINYPYISWKISTTSQLFLCDANENLINGRCIQNNQKHLQFIRGRTTNLTLPIIEFQQDFTIELWCLFNFTGISGPYPFTENIIQRPGSVLIQFVVTGSTTGSLLAYGNQSLSYIQINIATLSTIDGVWTHISFGQSCTINKSLLMLIVGSQPLNIMQATGTATTLISTPLLIEVGSSTDATSLNALIKEVRIWSNYKGAGLIIEGAFKELLPYKLNGTLLGYWKLNEADGNTIKDYSEFSLTATLLDTATRISPRWAYIPDKPFLLCGPNQYFVSWNGLCKNIDQKLMFYNPTTTQDYYTLNVGNSQLLSNFTLNTWINIQTYPSTISAFFVIYVQNLFELSFLYSSATVSSYKIGIGPTNTIALNDGTIKIGTWSFVSLTYCNNLQTLSVYSANNDASNSYRNTVYNPSFAITAGTNNILIRDSNCKVYLQNVALYSTSKIPLDLFMYVNIFL